MFSEGRDSAGEMGQLRWARTCIAELSCGFWRGFQVHRMLHSMLLFLFKVDSIFFLVPLKLPSGEITDQVVLRLFSIEVLNAR